MEVCPFKKNRIICNLITVFVDFCCFLSLYLVCCFLLLFVAFLFLFVVFLQNVKNILKIEKIMSIRTY